MVEHDITLLVIGVPTVRCDRFLLQNVPIAQEISDMLDIGREIFQDFPVDN